MRMIKDFTEAVIMIYIIMFDMLRVILAMLVFGAIIVAPLAGVAFLIEKFQ